MTRYSAGALSGTGSVGSAMPAAAAASAPYASLRPSGCNACPASVFTSANGMPHSAAAAWRMSQRPCAPNWRSSAQPSGMLVLPPAPCAPQRQRGSAPLKSIDIGICSTDTCDQSASSSSARIIGRDVLTPCPISAPVAPITIRLSGSMRIRTPSGFSGWRGVASWHPAKRGASTSAPDADSEVCRKCRRETTAASTFISTPSGLAQRVRWRAGCAHRCRSGTGS